MTTPTQDQEPVYFFEEEDENGRRSTRLVLTPHSDTRNKCVMVKPFVIPIVFIPGIMGSNLKRGSTPVWTPPNLDGIRPMWRALQKTWEYSDKNAAARQRDLTLYGEDPLEVDPDNEIDPGNSGLSQKECHRRGWGGVLRSSYHPFLANLQHYLNGKPFMEMGKLGPWWQEGSGLGRSDPMQWGGLPQAPMAPLTEQELFKAAYYRYEVWAAPYVWLQDNGDSAVDIKQTITDILQHYNHQGGKLAQQVILVTHSMGGLVARALTGIENDERVLGVVHGVLPGSGAPATYKRMRAGFEGAANTILGRDAEETTAIMATAPGPLQLLPFRHYQQGKPWLKVMDRSRLPPRPVPRIGGDYRRAEPDALLALPQADPYQEIYLSRAWYGLIPEQSEALINPAKLKLPSDDTLQAVQDPAELDNAPGQLSPARRAFQKAMMKVEEFHSKIADHYHPHTYVHYGAEGPGLQHYPPLRNQSEPRLAVENLGATWQDVVWLGQVQHDPLGILANHSMDDNKTGQISLGAVGNLQILPPDAAGDGTVPLASARDALRFLGKQVRGAFEHGNYGPPGQYNQHPGYEHQNSYIDRWQRPLYATLYSIIKIAQDAT